MRGRTVRVEVFESIGGRLRKERNGVSEECSGNKAKRERKICMNAGFSGTKLTMPSCSLSRRIAESNCPAATWSAASVELRAQLSV